MLSAARGSPKLRAVATDRKIVGCATLHPRYWWSLRRACVTLRIMISPQRRQKIVDALRRGSVPQGDLASSRADVHEPACARGLDLC